MGTWIHSKWCFKKGSGKKLRPKIFQRFFSNFCLTFNFDIQFNSVLFSFKKFNCEYTRWIVEERCKNRYNGQFELIFMWKYQLWLACVSNYFFSCKIYGTKFFRRCNFHYTFLFATEHCGQRGIYLINNFSFSWGPLTQCDWECIDVTVCHLILWN